MFLFSRYPYLIRLNFLTVFSIFFLSKSGFCLSPKGVSAWTEGNRKVSIGAYGQGEALLTVALREGEKSQLSETKNHIALLISNDLAACLEKRGFHEDAADLYKSVVERASIRSQKVGVYHINALRGLIRCHLSCSLSVEPLVQLMNKWNPQGPASYCIGSTWCLLPFCSSFESPDLSIIAFLSDFFLLTHSQAEELLAFGTKSYSFVVFFKIEDAFVAKLKSFGKNFSKDQLIEKVSTYTKEHSPVIPPHNQEAKWVEQHTSFSTMQEPNWLFNWRTLFQREIKSCYRITQLESLMVAVPITSPFKEIRARLFLEKGLLYLSLNEENKAREAFLHASRSDQYGVTRTTASAMSYILALAIQQKDIGLCRKALHRAERLYLFSPKILQISIGDLFIESADSRFLEGIFDLIIKRGREVAGWTLPPKGLLLSASSNVLFWESFENDITNAPNLKTAVTALRILSGYGFFGTPSKGWLVTSLLGSIQDDDI